MGGAIALTMALNHPEHVVALGLVGTGARLRVAPTILENSESKTTFPVAVKAVTEMAFSPKSDPRLMQLAGQRMRMTRPSVFHGDFVACHNFDVMEDLKKIRFPAVVICGEDDQLTPVRYSQYLEDQIQKAQLKIVPEAGHMVMLEQPHAVADELSAFLSSFTYTPG
jgi:pimeloyl-ACP methyl ester carboxylesterase